MPRAVILGTGTGVGKTYFTVALARALASAGHQVRALKPVETGYRTARGSDARRLERASNLPAPIVHPLYRFRAPISPHLAARRAHLTISPTHIARWVDSTTLHDNVWSLLETAGGAFSPLGSRTTNVDLAKRLEPSFWILVAPDALGVLHDVRAALAALDSTARLPDFVVLSASRAPDASTGTNGLELARLGVVRPAAILRRAARLHADLGPLVNALTRAARRL